MSKRFFPVSAALGASLMAFVPGVSHGATSFGVVPLALVKTAASSYQPCSSRPAPAMGQVQIISAVGKAGKSSAILGGRVSKLELMRRQQAAAKSEATGEPQPVQLASPGTAPGYVANKAACAQLAFPKRLMTLGATDRIASPIATPLSSDDFLASKRLRVRRTSFDADWRRVQGQSLSRGTVASLTQHNPGPVTMATLQAVNSWTNARVRYVEDRDLYGRADYWASASTTLLRSAGDCEDIAIVKMQVLAALGVRRSDMYLTVARDLVRNADHAVLIVKKDGKHWLLDNSTNVVLDASHSHDYRPIMSFSTSNKWLHGYAAKL